MSADVVDLPVSGWLDKQKTADYFDVSKRTIERWMAAGMPHTEIGGKIKFKPAERCEPWLEEQGLIEHKGAA